MSSPANNARMTQYTVTGLGAGASDAIGRLALVRDVVTHYIPEARFCLPEYKNYHCPGLDFLSLFGIDQTWGDPGSEQDPDVDCRFSDFVAQRVTDGGFEGTGGVYRFKADVQHATGHPNAAVQTLIDRDGLELNSLKGLSYHPIAQPFTNAASDVKVVIHLRRKDICRGAIFDAEDFANPLPDSLMTTRPLLTVQEAVSVLEQVLEPNSKVEILVFSDGFEWLRSLYGKHDAVQRKIDRLEQDVRQEPKSHRLDIQFQPAVIGSGAEETRLALDAMYHADLVVTKSSSFPRLPCAAGGTRLIEVQAEHVAQFNEISL